MLHKTEGGDEIRIVVVDTSVNITNEMFRYDCNAYNSNRC